MESPELDPAPIFAVLARHQVDYVLIGGLAAVAYGSPILTQDMDITPDVELANLGRLSDALRELGATIRTAGVDDPLPFAHNAQSLADVRVWNLQTPSGDLDISFVPNGTSGYSDLVRAARPTQFFGSTVMVADLADVIRSKQAANRDKDLRVLPVLREILARGLHERPPTQT